MEIKAHVYIVGQSYCTVVFGFKRWRRELVKIACEYTPFTRYHSTGDNMGSDYDIYTEITARIAFIFDFVVIIHF